MTNIVSGAVSTVTELGQDEAWLHDWLKEQPNRLGLGDLNVAESAAESDHNFVATDDEHCFSVDVQLGEMEASRGFQVLDDWARNRVAHPDKTHVAVLVTEVMSDRYQTTFETLAEHLPLVVVELAVWKGENEAIVVPHIALSSNAVDLTETPAAKSAEAVAKVDDATDEKTETVAEAEAETEANAAVTTETDAEAKPELDETPEAEVLSEAEAVAAEAEAQADADVASGEADGEAPEDKDDTGVGDPWGFKENSNGSAGLLTKVGK